MKEHEKIGLALGGGGARGLAHIGVMEVFQEEEVPIDMIAGASIGALIGAIFAQGKDASVIQNVALGLNWKRLVSLIDFVPLKSGLIGGKKVSDLLKSIMGDDVRFSDLKIPLACVATDARTCDEVVIDQGSVLEAVRASISIPGIFTVVKWKDRYLVDGGMVNPVPVSILRRMGADFVIAVNVIPDMGERAHQLEKIREGDFKEPNIFQIIIQSIQMAQCLLVRSCLEGADIVIKPQVAHIGFGDFHRAQECIMQGELDARNSIPEIKRLLGI